MGLLDRMPRLNPRIVDHGHVRPEWVIRDFLDPTGEIGRWGQRGASLEEILAAFPGSLVRTQRFIRNCLLNEGINAACNLICGAGGTAFNNANSYIGVGDSSATALASQTGLQASSNKYYNGMDASYPTSGSNQQMVFRSTFPQNVANFAWNEITAANGSSDSAMNLNRLVQSMGTKTSAWTRQVTLTITLA
jgi:hypothetical protein